MTDISLGIGLSPSLEIGIGGRNVASLKKNKVTIGYLAYFVFGIISIVILSFWSIYLPVEYLNMKAKEQQAFINNSSASRHDFSYNMIGLSIACILWALAIMMSLFSLHENDPMKKKSYTEKAKHLGIAGGVFCGIAFIPIVLVSINDSKENISNAFSQIMPMSRSNMWSLK